MAVRTLITRGYGNGTFNGTIAEMVLRGYTFAAAASIVLDIAPGRQITIAARARSITIAERTRTITIPERTRTITITETD